MKRSLFTALFSAFATTLAIVALAGFWLHNWQATALIALVLAFAAAWLVTHSIKRSLNPLEAAAASILNPSTTVPRPQFAALDDLAAALEVSSRAAVTHLDETAAGRRELEALLDSMQDAVVAVDSAGRIQWTNSPMRRLMLRLMPGTPESGTVRVGHALVQTLRDPEVLACVNAALEQGYVAERRATSVVPGRIFDVNAAPMPHGGAVAVLHDITRLERMERAQRDFVANVSHELRTPLTSITGYVETLLDAEDSAQSAAVTNDFLRIILKNAIRMNHLTEDLLVLARVESGEHAVRPVRVKTSTVVKEAVDSMMGLVRDTAATLEIAKTTDAEIMADSDAVVRVLSNLIENALKYGLSPTIGANSPAARIIVSAVPDPQRSDFVRFSVQDFGAGIPSEHIGRLFERFYRVDKGRSRDSGGTGLGLAIVRRLMEAQNGTVWVESDLGRGSTFFFTLPLAFAGEADSPDRTANFAAL